ncbi:hypothetical protein Emed_000056 [Eimeria media]
MEKQHDGFLSAIDERSMAIFKGRRTSDCPLDPIFNKGTQTTWLDNYRDEACRVARYPDSSFIPGAVRTAINVCVNKSGLSSALPDAIVKERQNYVDRLHTAVQASAVQTKPLSNRPSEPTPIEGQTLASFPLYDDAWVGSPTYNPSGRYLQQLSSPAPQIYLPGYADGPDVTPSRRAYLESMPYNLLPIFVGFVVFLVLIPIFLLLVCFRNRNCCRSCWCCLRAFFKPVKRRMGPLQRWDSLGSSSTASESSRGDRNRKLVPRRSCIGLRYVVLFVAIVAVAGALSLGIYALVELHGFLSQLSCSTGQAASTIINGQTFTTPPVSPRRHNTASSFTAPFSPRSPFDPESQPTTATQSPPSSAASVPSVPRGATDVHWLSALKLPSHSMVPRLLQSDHSASPPSDEEALPKRTGFLGFAPALDYFQDLLLALDPKREESLPKTLRQAGVMASRITKLITETKQNVKKLQKLIKNPANSGGSVLVDRGGDGRPEEELTYHASLVAAGSSSLLTSWDTLLFLLPQGLAAIAEASDSLAEQIESSLEDADELPPVDQLQSTRRRLTDSLAAAQDVLEPIPKLSEPLFWGTIVTFAVMGSLLLLASLYLCCLCCCKKEALVDRRGSSCGCSFVLLVVAALSLVLSGALLIATTAVTDGCLYTRSYVQTAGDIDNLLNYFNWGTEKRASPRPQPPGSPSSATARVLEACLLPNKERDLVKVFGLEELIAGGEKMRQLGSVVMRSEAASAVLLSAEFQEAAKELQLIEEAYWVFLLDPLLLEEEDLTERMYTYREVLCSGLQDKQRSLKASYISKKPPPAPPAAPAAAGGGAASEGGRSSRVSSGEPVLLQAEDWQPLDELDAMLKDLTPTPEAAERLSLSVQQALEEVRNTSSTRGEKAKKLIGGVLSEVMQLAAGKTDAERAELLKAVVRLAGKINAEYEADASASSERSEAVKRKRRQRRRRALLLSLLQETCMQAEQPTAGSRPPHADAEERRLVVFGMEDVEERVAPFSLASLRSSSSNNSGEDQLRIDASFDPGAPHVFELAAEKGAPDEQRRFVNAVWWAVKKEQLRASNASSFVCPDITTSDGSRGSACNLEAMQEATHLLTRKLRAQPLGDFICDKVRVSGANMALILLVVGCSALLLLPCFCCLWRAGVENKWRQRDADASTASGSRANSNPPTTPDWTPRSPPPLSGPQSQNHNAAAAAAVAVAAAATAAAASGLSQQQQQQEQQNSQYQQQHQQELLMHQRQYPSYSQQMRSGDWR